MAHPLLWPFKLFFYPVGNTAAICLTQDLPPEQPADVLLLGCGDARNVLYTVHVDGRLEGGERRKLDITCCDIEPAVLARNVVLYTLLKDGHPVDTVFDIFYHFTLNKTALDILVRQSQRLCDASATVEDWSRSPYGAFLMVCTEHTLGEMRRFWQLYASFAALGKASLQRLQEQRKACTRSVLESARQNVSASLSAGMLWHEAADDGNKLYQRYWKTGTTFSSDKDIAAATHLNPTFAYCSTHDSFSPHRGTFPGQAFHLTPAYVPATGPGGAPATKDVVALIRGQFQAWTASFKGAVSSDDGSLIIRFCVSEVLAFCRALEYRQDEFKAHSTPLFVSPNSSQLLELRPTDGTPKSFDVIDTSNLTDHVGLVNILLATTSLLKPGRFSTIYTEAMLSQGNEAVSSFLSRVCGDVPAMSLLLGLVPRALLAGLTTQSNVHELLANSVFNSGQYHERVAWCRPTSGDQSVDCDVGVAMDARQFGRLLFHVYDQLLAKEKLADMRKSILLSKSTGVDAFIPHYTRAIVGRLAQTSMKRVTLVEGDCADAISVFLTAVEQDRARIIGMNYYQDLCMQLHLHGVFSTDVLTARWRSEAPPNGDMSIFEGWASVPSVVSLVLVVPRQRLDILREYADIGSIGLEVRLATGGGRHDNRFSTIHAIPGRLRVASSSRPLALRVEEERRGIEYAESLIVALLVPAWMLTVSPTAVALVLQNTPRTTRFASKLGFYLELFTAELTNKAHVHVVPEYLGIGPRQDVPPASAYVPESPAHPPAACVNAQLNVDKSCALSSMISRVDLSRHGFATAISSSVEISASQTSPCTMDLRVQDKRIQVAFPYPVSGDKHKLRIARKSLYVEVIIPPTGSGPLTLGGYTVNRFPVLRSSSSATASWNLHRVSLLHAPTLNIKAGSEQTWLRSHLWLQMSDRERNLQETIDFKDMPRSEVLVSVKDTLWTILFRASGVHPHQSASRVISLCAPEPIGSFAAIFVNRLCLDPAAFTVVADIALLPFDVEYMHVLGESLQRVRMNQINVTHAEIPAWKRLFPALVERCRTFAHGPNCEYASEGVPRSIELTRSPLCACGRGHALPKSMAGVPDALWSVLRPYATRAAISPLFAVSFVEAVGGAAKNGAPAAAGSGAAGASRTAEQRPAQPSTQARPPTAPKGERCWACGGAGRPKLLTCSKCKRAKYCSAECSRENWRVHRAECKPT